MNMIYQKLSDENSIYWALTFNLPEELSKAVPEFKQGNEAAKPGIEAWGAFKANPSKETYDKFISALGNFAQGE